MVTPSEVRCVGGADAEAMPVGIGGDEGVAEGELGGFQSHGEAELAPGTVNAVDIVAGVAHCASVPRGTRLSFSDRDLEANSIERRDVKGCRWGSAL